MLWTVFNISAENIIKSFIRLGLKITKVNTIRNKIKLTKNV
jgi:hypothetical protein